MKAERASTSVVPDPVGPLTHRQITVIVAALLTGVSLAALDQSVVSTALHAMTSSLGGADKASWVVAAYLITSTASAPLYGKLSDMHGRKPVYQFVTVVFLVGSMLSGLSQNMTQLILFRALQGLGGGGLLTIAMAILADIVSPRERGRYQGYFGAVFALSSVLGPLAGGLFTDYLSWHWIFFINVPLGLVAWYVIGAKLHLPQAHRAHRVDYAGAAVLVLSVSLLLLVAEWGGQHFGWLTLPTLTMTASALALLVLFGWIEARAAEPVLPLRLFRSRTFSLCSAVLFTVGAGLFGALIYTPFYLQIIRGFSPTEAGLYMVTLTVGTFTASIVVGRLITRTGRIRRYVSGGLLTMTLTMGAVAAVLRTNVDLVLLGALLMLLGAAMGACLQPILLIVQNDAVVTELGVATAAASFFRSLGAIVGATTFGAILNASRAAPGVENGLASGAWEPQSYVAHLATAFWVSVPLCAIALICLCAMPKVRLGESSAISARTLSAAGVEA